jgi:drug/metabolite transporter (DMT)-like permease
VARATPLTVSPATHPSARIWTALLVVYIVWGSTYLGIELAVRTIPPFTMAAIRFFVAGGILYVWAASREGRWRRPPNSAEWGRALVTGAALLTVGNGAVGWAEDRGVDIGTAALIVASMPLWLALFDRVLFGQRLGRPIIVGLFIGFAGVAVLVTPGGQDSDLAGELAMVVGAAVWALGSLYARRPTSMSLALGASMQMLAGGMLLLVIGLASGEAAELHAADVSATSLLGLAYLVVFGSLLAFTAYVWLLRAARTSLVGTYAYVNPVVAVLLGSIVLDEALSWQVVTGGGIVLAAVALIVSGPRLREPRTVAAVPARGK